MCNKVIKLSDIAKENDEFRCSHYNNFSCVLTQGLHILGAEFVREAMEMVRNFKDFNKGNDPYGEHNFGSFTCQGKKVFWKIDTYTNDTYPLPKILNFNMSNKVMTVMLAEEY